jgi:hypothetical protein
MQEIIPGIWHWTAPNPRIGDHEVSSYWLDGGVFIDPILPTGAEDLDWFDEQPVGPQAVVLCNRHHYRDSDEIHEQYGCQVYVPEAGLHSFTDGQPVTGYKPGERLPGDLIAVEVGGLSPDDGGLYLQEASAFWLADTLVRSMTDPGSPLGWVSDSLMDDPPQTKRAMLEAFQRMLDSFEFTHLMLAHGLPLVGDGRAQLEQFVREGGRTSTDAF